MTVLVIALLLLSGCHFCVDELNALVLLVPGVAFFLNWLRTTWRVRHQPGHCVHPDGHSEEHVLTFRMANDVVEEYRCSCGVRFGCEHPDDEHAAHVLDVEERR